MIGPLPAKPLLSFAESNLSGTPGPKSSDCRKTVTKNNFFHPTAKDRRDLILAGFDPEHIKGAIKILEYTFAPLQGRTADQ